MSLLAAVESILDGRDAPMIPIPAGNLRESELLTSTLRVGEEIDEDVALVIATSGTTSAPKGAMLTPAALIASAAATHDRLGGPGTWLLALPPHHIAGMQVLVRSVLAGTVPAELDVSAGFDPAEALTAGTRENPTTSTRRSAEPRLIDNLIVPSLATGTTAVPKNVPVDRAVKTGIAVEFMFPCTVMVGVSALAANPVTRIATAATPDDGTAPWPVTRTTASR